MDYATDEAARDAVDAIQKNVIEHTCQWNRYYYLSLFWFCQGKCCGLNNATDWIEVDSTYFNETLSLPESCKCEIGNEYCANFTLEFDDEEYPQNDYYKRVQYSMMSWL